MQLYHLRHTSVSILIAGVALFCVNWGILGHERIHHLAVLQLPEQPGVFFYNHLDFVVQSATVPDLRKYSLADKEEFPKHFVHLEQYGAASAWPDSLPALQSSYPPAVLRRNGILPWYLVELTQKLSKAFRAKRKTEILFLAADLGHYLGDAHMPLHTTTNHDGQLSGQQGVHALWEAHLPELFANGYRFDYRPANYLPDIKAAAWNLVQQTHALADTLLQADKRLRDSLPLDLVYEKDASGQVRLNKFGQKVHSQLYAGLYHRALHGMVERQLNRAAQCCADFWYTAWCNAGGPDLSGLDDARLNKKNKLRRKHDIQRLKKQRLHFSPAEREF